MFPLNGKISLSNSLNEGLANESLSLMMMRIISWYLVRINPVDLKTKKRIIRIKDLSEFFEISINMSAMDKTILELSEYEVSIFEYDKSTEIPFFSVCKMGFNEAGEDVIILDCSEKIEKYIFDLKREYTNYPAWNTITMKSVSTVRLYQVLKQYKKIGKRILSISKLKRMLGIKETAYERNKDFYRYILKHNCTIINNNTDLFVEYNIIGRKTKMIQFIIKDNPNRIDHESMFLDRYLRMSKSPKFDEKSIELYQFLSEACENKFSCAQMHAIVTHAREFVAYPGTYASYKLEMYSFIEKKYAILKSKKNVIAEFGYMMFLIKNNI